MKSFYWATINRMNQVLVCGLRMRGSELVELIVNVYRKLKYYGMHQSIWSGSVIHYYSYTTMHAIQQLMTWSCLFNSIGIHIHTIDCEGLHLLIWTNLNKDIFLLVLQLFINTEIFTWCRNLCLYSLNIEDWISLVINLTITVYGQIENKLFKNWLLNLFFPIAKIVLCQCVHWILFFNKIQYQYE